MTETSPLAPIAGLTIIACVGAVIFAIRSKIYSSGNNTAITMMKVSDTLVMIRFITGLVFMLMFVAIAISVGGGQGD